MRESIFGNELYIGGSERRFFVLFRVKFVFGFFFDFVFMFRLVFSFLVCIFVYLTWIMIRKLLFLIVGERD